MDPWDGLLRFRFCHFVAMATIQWMSNRWGFRMLTGPQTLAMSLGLLPGFWRTCLVLLVYGFSRGHSLPWSSLLDTGRYVTCQSGCFYKSLPLGVVGAWKCSLHYTILW